MKNQPLLSVIVPCYNVEQYADKCISSIVGQTYSNLEIILVNDGSIDQTGAICDAWLTKDARIRIIHKQNEGVSYARKTGLDHATAGFVAFVDADDWIDVNMYADMMYTLLSTNSDIVHCNACFVYEDGRIEPQVEKQNFAFKTMGRVESILMILTEHHRTSLNTKIFKKELFDHVSFPKGRICGEDMIVHDLFHRASQTVFLNEAYYFYLQRTGSATKSLNIQKETKAIQHFFEAYLERYHFTKQHLEYHDALPYIERMVLGFGNRLLNAIILYPQFYAPDFFYTVSNQLYAVFMVRKVSVRRSVQLKYYVLKHYPKSYMILRKIYLSIINMTNSLKITNKKIPCFVHID